MSADRLLTWTRSLRAESGHRKDRVGHGHEGVADVGGALVNGVAVLAAGATCGADVQSERGEDLGKGRQSLQTVRITMVIQHRIIEDAVAQSLERATPGTEPWRTSGPFVCFLNVLISN